MSFPYQIEELASQHKHSAFACGAPALDRYLREQATQDIRRQVSKCFVALEGEGAVVAGFYTLAASSVPLDLLPDDLKRRLPRYPTVPVARIGRLAVDQAHRGKQLGAALVYNAGIRAARADMGVFALVVDAKDESAEAFYRHFGFTGFASRQLLMPLATLKANALPAG